LDTIPEHKIFTHAFPLIGFIHFLEGLIDVSSESEETEDVCYQEYFVEFVEIIF
jgi:hypothetical protein